MYRFLLPFLCLTYRGSCSPHRINCWFSRVLQFYPAHITCRFSAAFLPHADLPPNPIYFYSKKIKKHDCLNDILFYTSGTFNIFPLI